MRRIYYLEVGKDPDGYSTDWCSSERRPGRHEGIQSISPGDPVVCIGIDDSDNIYGCYNEKLRMTVDVVAQPPGRWRLVDTDPGWYPSAVSCNGLVAGRINTRGFHRPWLRLLS